MMHAISIVLIVAIALQTVGCSTWRPVVRVAKSADDDRQSSVRDHVLGKLNEGMAVRIRILEGASAPIKSEVIEGKIETIGPKSLTVIFESDYFRGGEKEKLTLHFSDISTSSMQAGSGVRLGFYLPVLRTQAGDSPSRGE